MCTYRCEDGISPYDKYYCKTGSMTIATTHERIMRDLVDNGPMMLGLQIYEDFMNYKEGIYVKTTGENIGGHAMKLVGYGLDPTLGLYWEMQNQWTTEWGDEGFIKIKAGEIGIDSVGLSCMPDLI